MNEQFQERRHLFLILIGLIFVLLLVLYFAVLQPMISEKQEKEARVLLVQKDIADLKIKNKRAAAQEKGNETALHYQTKMPQSPQLDQLMGSLEEIQAVSMSRIEKIEFSYDTSLSKQDSNGEENEKNKDTDHSIADAGLDQVESSIETKQSTNVFLKETPKNLHTISMRMKVTSPDYAHFDQLVKAIEKLDRITFVHTLQFKQPAEAALVLEEFPDESVTCTVELMTFYYADSSK